WLFGSVSLMNVGYFVTSALSGSGDWARVIADGRPALAWRAGLGLVWLGLYVMVVRQATALMNRPLREGRLSIEQLRWLTLSSYLAGGAVMVAASVFNPIGPSLILTSAVGASFGLTCGLLLVAPRLATATAPEPGAGPQPIPRHWGWIAAGLCVAVWFVAVLGRGIRF